MYRPEDVPIRPNVDLDTPLKDQDHWFKIYRYDFRHYNLHLPYAERLPEGYSLRHLIAEYYGMTTWMDSAVGRMLAALDEAGLADDTIVVFVSDHGDNLGSLGLVQKGGPNEESIRVPMLIRWPMLRRGASVVRSHVMSLVDVAPTLLSLVGVDVPEHMPGRDLAPLCCGEDSDAVPHAVVETRGGAAIRSPGHLCFLPFVQGTHQLADQPTKLFDLAEDPYELQNRAGDPAAVAEARELVTALREWDAATPWMTE